VSTRYDEEETIYLYKADYNSTNNDYEEISDNDYNAISDHQEEVRDSKSAIVSAVKAKATPKTDGTCGMLSWTEVSDENSESVNGKVTLTYNVADLAEKFYRPITYTVVVVNDKNHAASRQTVTITQYPSKYIEFGFGGNAFVNGYYAHLVPDEGYSSSDLPAGSTAKSGTNGTYYQSYFFTYSDYSTDKAAYYTTTSSTLVNSNNYYGTSASGSYDGYEMINTSYEFLNGSIEKATVKFYNTIDVHVTAFTSSDKTYTADKVRTYQIGDPRQTGSFTNDAHQSGSYVRTGNTLYDYYTYGEQSGSNFYRHVSPWPDVTSIKIGGTSTKYDDIISPLFKIQSTYGTAKTGVYFDVAQKRCATYQEAGYPAGRWRLPTLAEIAFIVRLQNEGIIDNMFNLNSNSSGYWTSSGGCVKKASSSSSEISYTANQNSGSYYVRCVYDLWYWGDKQVTPTHVFHPMPTK
jgi:hypothetical protein